MITSFPAGMAITCVTFPGNLTSRWYHGPTTPLAFENKRILCSVWYRSVFGSMIMLRNGSWWKSTIHVQKVRYTCKIFSIYGIVIYQPTFVSWTQQACQSDPEAERASHRMSICCSTSLVHCYWLEPLYSDKWALQRRMPQSTAMIFHEVVEHVPQWHSRTTTRSNHPCRTDTRGQLHPLGGLLCLITCSFVQKNCTAV